MLIVIDGLDRTGKTTLARRYVDAAADAHGRCYLTQGTGVIHFSKPEKHPLREYIEPLLEHHPKTDIAILDRSHLGEQVWPTIFGRKTEMTVGMHIYIEMFYASRGAVLVRTVRDLLNIEEDCLVEDEPIQGEQIITANALMNVAFTESSLPLYELDIKRTINKTAPYVDAFANAQHAGIVHNITSEFVGSLAPSVLLVGDTGNTGPGRVAPWRLPFVPFVNTSGGWLLNELQYDDLWRRTAIVNSVDSWGMQTDIHALTQVLGDPFVIAMGANAHEVLRSQNVEHGLVPHPQYVRRFLRKNGTGYLAGLILEEVNRASN